MLPLNLPPYEFSVRQGATPKIFDIIRKKYVVLTPEEWVRQNFLQYLVVEKKYPAALIHVEHPLKVYKLQKRCDAVAFDNKGNPLVIMEFKSSDVVINQAVFDQIARYNIALKVKYLIVSNGKEHYCCIIDAKSQSCHFLEDIPEYSAL